MKTKVAARLSGSKKREIKTQTRKMRKAKMTSGDVSLTGVLLFMGIMLYLIGIMFLMTLNF